MNNFLSGPMAQYLRDQGRFGDTELAHVNPEEEALLRSRGGSGTINPSTGLREYYSEEEENEGGWSGVGDDGKGKGEGKGEGKGVDNINRGQNVTVTKTRDTGYGQEFMVNGTWVTRNELALLQDAANATTTTGVNGDGGNGDNTSWWDSVTTWWKENNARNKAAHDEYQADGNATNWHGYGSQQAYEASLRDANSGGSGSGSGSGSGTTTTSTTPAAPDYTTSEGFKSLLFDLFKSKVLDQPYESYGGNRFAGFNADQTQAFTDTRAFSNSSNEAINDAITAASGETGYSSGYNPGVLTSGYIPGVSTSGYNPNAYRSQYDPNAYTSAFTARDYTSGYDPSAYNVGYRTAGKDSDAWQKEVDSRMNPFTSNVINRLQGDMDRSRLQALGKTKDQARSARAFGGSRQGVVEALTSGEYADAFSRTAGGLRQDQFNKAMAGADADRLAAEKFAQSGYGMNQQAQQAAEQFRQGAFGLTTQERSLAEQYRRAGYDSTQAAMKAKEDLRRMGYDSTQAAMKAKEQLRQGAFGQTEQAKQTKEEFLQSAWAQTEAAKRAKEQFLQSASGIRSGAGRDLLTAGQADDAATAARINALYGIGARGQALEQANKDFAYQQFLEERDYDKMNILAGGGLLGSAPGDPEKQTYFTREGGAFSPFFDLLFGKQNIVNV